MPKPIFQFNVWPQVSQFQRVGFLVRWLVIAGIMILGVGRVYLATGFPYTHDGENHLARFANYKIALKEGQFPPRLAPNLLNHYTYPVFNYNYPLANILAMPGAFLKLNYEVIFKLLALGALVGLGIGTELWLKSLHYSSGARWVTVLTLASTPFLVNLVWFRGNIGELMALALFPWGLWLIERLTQGNKIGWQSWGLTGVLGLILLAHNIAALMLLPLLLAYGWWRATKWSVRWQLVSLWIWAILASVWFWLPALAEKSSIVLDQARFFQEYSAHFVTLSQLVWSPITFGFSYPGSVDNLSFGLGFTVVIVLVLSFAMLFLQSLIWLKNRWLKKPVPQNFLISQPALLLGLIVAGLIWLQTKASWPVWQLLSPLSYLQFPWRLALPVTILVLPAVASWWQLAQTHKIIWLRWLVVIAIALSWCATYHLKAADYFHRTNVDYEAFSQTTSTLNENLPKHFQYTQIGDWQPTPQLLTGSGQITLQIWRGSVRQYRLVLATPATIVEPSIVWAGFETRANQKLVQYVDSDAVQGRLAYQLPAGTFQVETRFTQHTWPRQVGNTVSVLALLGWLGWAAWNGRKWLSTRQTNKRAYI